MAIAKHTELSCGSPESFDDAIKRGLDRASKTLKNIRGAWIKDQSVVIGDNGRISEFRVDLKVTFVLED